VLTLLKEQKVHLVVLDIGLPDTVDIKSKITPEIRYRGIYEAILYNTTLSIDGLFPRAPLKDLRIKPENIEWSGAFTSFGITDMRGIRDRIDATFDGTRIEYYQLFHMHKY
jgi:inner membrane protein